MLLRAAKVDGARARPRFLASPFDGDPISANCRQLPRCWIRLLRNPLASTGRPIRGGLPLYPWDRQSFWFGLTAEGADPVNTPLRAPASRFSSARSGTVAGSTTSTSRCCRGSATMRSKGWPVLPAAGILEMACAAARVQWPDAPVLELRDLEVRRPAAIRQRTECARWRAVIGSEEGDWELASRARLSNEPFTVHAVGRLGAGKTDTRRTLHFSDSGPTRRRIDEQTLYDLARLAGLDYGARFRTVSLIEITGPENGCSHISIPRPVAEDFEPYLVHPALLDGGLQALIGLLAACRDQVRGTSFLPWRFGRVRFFGAVRTAATARPAATYPDRRPVGIRGYRPLRRRRQSHGRKLAEVLVPSGRSGTRGIDRRARALRVDLIPAPLNESTPPLSLGACRDRIVAPCRCSQG